MKLSTRQRRITELLLCQQDEITAADIAAEVGASTRTIHRELLDLEPILAASGISLLKKSGIGIRLEADEDKLEQFKLMLNHSAPIEYSAEERKVLILCKLLDTDEPIKLFTLAHELHVTMPTISNDLDEIEKPIAQQSLTLIRRRGYGIELTGPESAKRQLISSLAIDHLDDSDLFGQHSGQAHTHPLTAQLLAMVGIEQFFKLERALWKLNEQWPLHLSEDAYTRLLIKLSVTLTRIKQQNMIPARQVDHDEPITENNTDNSQLSTLLQLLELELPAVEKDYVSRLLTSGSQHESGLLIHHLDMSLIETVNLLIQKQNFGWLNQNIS